MDKRKTLGVMFSIMVTPIVINTLTYIMLVDWDQTSVISKRGNSRTKCKNARYRYLVHGQWCYGKNGIQVKTVLVKSIRLAYLRCEGEDRLTLGKGGGGGGWVGTR
jgi:hypothetical protein